MLKIGLTGGIGSGKSYVGKIFGEMNIPVYEADREARRLMEKDSAIRDSVVSLFGNKAYEEEKLNNTYIGSIVFNDRIMLDRLNAIVHPAVQDDFLKWAETRADYPYVIEEAAILFESGAAKNMDYIIFVKADLETRIERVMKRDQVSREVVQNRIKNQGGDREKEKLADFIINNDNDSMILPQIVDLHNTFCKYSK